MSDFKKYLLAGIDAAKTAAANKEEIYAVINEVNRQLSEIYDSKVHFGIWSFTRPKGMKTRSTIGSALALFGVEQEDYESLAISNHENKNPTPLADWFMSENGYPCKIIMDGVESFCSDKDDLEIEISNLLSNIRTGKAILNKLEEYNDAQAQD